MEDTEWFKIDNIDSIDSPALLIYTERMRRNLQKALLISGNPALLRPHVKTSKIAEVSALMMEHGITKFKAATIAETEMLAMIGAPDVLLAYQPSAPKLERFISLITTYPSTHFSCLVDNEKTASLIAAKALEKKLVISVYVDLNIGMNRSGIKPAGAIGLAINISSMPALQLEGLHAYDGHIHDTDPKERKLTCELAMEPVFDLQKKMESLLGNPIRIVAGGTPTFGIQAIRAADPIERGLIECSPGTFIFWDQGYSEQVPDLPFEPAAVLITRVVSIVDEQTICTDLGHKAVASEMPFPRAYFLNLPGAKATGHSEEHLTIKVTDSAAFQPGDCIYCLPKHICPTVALYEKVYVVKNNKIVAEWKTVARDRFINI